MSDSSTPSPRVVIIPGMGCTPTLRSNWYGWLHKQLMAHGVQCVGEDFPDHPRCRENIWLPFMLKELQVDENCILVGHSTGSEAILRCVFLCVNS
jgi:predicted alpha/beta hydrolase family esterase